MIRRDYLERLIERVAAAVADALGLARAGHHGEARAEIDEAYRALGVAPVMLDRLDATTFAALSGEKLLVVRRIVEADAAVARLGADAERARRRERLAVALASRRT